MSRRLIWCLASLLACLVAFGQTTAKLEFEVVSIKPSAPPARGMRVGCRGGPGRPDPVLLVCQNLDLFKLVAIAYDLDDYQVSAPEWTHDVRYDLRAKVPEGTPKKQLGPMWQNLLADRFKLVVHRETRESQMYDLVVGKGGPKFKEASSVTPANDASRSSADLKLDKNGYPSLGPGYHGMAVSGMRARMYYPQLTMGQLAREVSVELEKPVNDKTGLSGKYEIGLYWVYSDGLPDTDSGPTLVEALSDQLGLRLESKKGPLEFVVVDHAERTPTDN